MSCCYQVLATLPLFDCWEFICKATFPADSSFDTASFLILPGDDRCIHCECDVANSYLPRNLFPVAAGKGRRSVDEGNVFQSGFHGTQGFGETDKTQAFLCCRSYYIYF